MKVLFITSEALPFAASGGLADVSGALPQALRRRMIGCRVVMPLYDSVPQELRDKMTFIAGISVPVAWRRQYCGVFEARHNGVVYYLLDNQYYFKRPGLYGHYDDAERFAFLSRAAIEILPHIGFKPDVLHANDWQCALVPLYYSLFYSQREDFAGMKTVYTIHNIQYQGQYDMEILEDVFGIPREAASLVEYDGRINLMKGGIETAHQVTTVSPTYAKEILSPWYAHRLETILQERQWKLSGILNGIDTVLYDPANDPMIPAAFDAEHPEGKAENKHALQERLGLPQRADVPLMAMVTRLVSHKGLDLVTAVMEDLLSRDIQFAVLGQGEWQYEECFRRLQEAYPDKFRLIGGFIPELAHKMYAGADLFLMPSKSEPCGLAQMVACRYGTLPIVRATGGLKDSIRDCGDPDGQGFVFQSYDAGDMMNAICRALELYAKPDEFRKVSLQAMRTDFSWARSANDYIQLYRHVLQNR